MKKWKHHIVLVLKIKHIHLLMTQICSRKQLKKQEFTANFLQHFFDFMEKNAYFFLSKNHQTKINFLIKKKPNTEHKKNFLDTKKGGLVSKVFFPNPRTSR